MQSCRIRSYNSVTFFLALSENIEAAFGHPPSEFQLDIGKALYLGFNAGFIAGTGAGMTTAFNTLSMLGKNMVKPVLVVYSRNKLQGDQ